MIPQKLQRDRWGKLVPKNTITVGTARQLLSVQVRVGQSLVRPDLPKTVALDVLGAGLDKRENDEPLHTVVANNVLRECGLVRRDDRRTCTLSDELVALLP